ncbi:MAG: ribose 5-phosphate isomerase B [Planctomycetia bacterium]|nr:ribose 5-phosphate isomerase B [Planctomycetia bacterium]
MRIAIGCDHRGKNLKPRIIEYLHNHGHIVEDCCTEAEENTSCDYPDIAANIAQKVSSGTVERGVLICGTGIGMQITANKFPGIRAAVCMDELTAEIARRHNNLNILCLSGDMLGERSLDGIIHTWLNTPFENGRHQRRLDKISEIEKNLRIR